MKNKIAGKDDLGESFTCGAVGSGLRPFFTAIFSSKILFIDEQAPFEYTS